MNVKSESELPPLNSPAFGSSPSACIHLICTYVCCVPCRDGRSEVQVWLNAIDAGFGYLIAKDEKEGDSM